MGHRYETAFKELRSVLQHFAHIGLRPFLCKSTLLGYARMCDLEPNDDDFSLCVLEDEFDEQLWVQTVSEVGWAFARYTRRDPLCTADGKLGGISFRASDVTTLVSETAFKDPYSSILRTLVCAHSSVSRHCSAMRVCVT